MNTEKHLKKNDEDKIWAERSFYAYETFCTVGILRRADEAKILRECQRLALTVQQVLNVYEPQSELAVLCRTYKAGQKYKISPMLFLFLEINLWMGRRCMGAVGSTPTDSYLRAGHTSVGKMPERGPSARRRGA